MFEKIKLIKELNRNISEYFFILPDGLYLKNNKKIINSNLIIKNILKKYNTGTPIKFKSETKKINIKKIVEQVEIAQIYNYNKTFESADIYDLTIEYMMKEINNYKYDLAKTPYENFLEIVIISTMIESLNNSKCLIGGMWSTGGLLTNQTKGKSSFEYFAKNVSEKNNFISIFREKMNKYPENFALTAHLINYPEFNKNKSDYSILLEYRMLQIKYKIVLQQICMHSSYMTEKEKNRFDADIKLLKNRLSEYPVKILKY